MNSIMTFSTNWLDIQPMEFFVSSMVMILFCLFPAISAMVSRYLGKPSSFNRIFNEIPSLIFMKILLPTSRSHFISGLDSFFTFSIFCLDKLICFCLSILIEPSFVCSGFLIIASILFSFFAISVSPVVFLEIAIFLISFLTLFTLSLVTYNLSPFAKVSVKFRPWFDLLAMRTSLCYDGFRHFRTFLRHCLGPLASNELVIGSFIIQNRSH